MKVQIGSFKGNPTISLDSDSKYPFSFGVKKAQLILQALPQIQAFVAKYAPPAGPDADQRHDMALEDQMARQCGFNV